MMNKINPFEYTLEKDDVLYFLHIPKAAGTSFIFILENYFEYDSILRAQAWEQLSENKPEDFTKFRFVKGHFGHAVHKIFPKKPIYITILRNPADLIISYLRMLKRQPDDAKRFHISENDSISNIILRQDITGVNNPICLWLNFDLDVPTLTNGLDPKLLKGFLPQEQPGFTLSELSDEEILDTAKQRLLDCVFFGLTERFEDSLNLLQYIFGWRPYRRLTKLNIAPEKKIEELSDEAKVELIKKTKLDSKLYEFAQKLFDNRYSRMNQLLREKYYDKNSTKINQDEITCELLEKHYQDRFLQINSPSSSIYYTFDQKFNGRGWHQREKDSPKNFFRWTGPETVSTIDFSLLTNEDFKIQFHISKVIAREILENVKLTINENPCKLNFSSDTSPKEGGRFETLVSKSILNHNKNFCRLTFELNHTIMPSSLNPKSTDNRKLGMALDWIKISSIK